MTSEARSSALAIGNWLLVIGESCATNSSRMRSASTTVTTASNLGEETKGDEVMRLEYEQIVCAIGAGSQMPDASMTM